MRNYDDMTERVFRRIHEYEDARSRRRKALRRIILTASPLCTAVIIAVGIYANRLDVPPAPIGSSSIITEEKPSAADTGESVTALVTSSTASKETSVTAAESVSASETAAVTGTVPTQSGTAEEVHEDNSPVSNTSAEANAPVTHTSAAAADTQPAQSAASDAVQEESAAPAPVSGGSGSMAISDRIYTATVNGALYLQIASFNGRTDLFTKDEMIGHGWDYQGDRYWDNTEIYTTKESKYILIARYESGTEIVLRRANDLIVGEDEYFITAWNSGDYTVKEENFIGTVSDHERIYFPYAGELSDPNVILEPGCRLYTADENADILIAVHTNGNAVILHKDHSV